MFKFPPILPPFFSDSSVQHEFEENGFVVVDFYNRDEISKLTEFFYNLSGIPEKGFFPTTFFQDNAVRDKIHEFVTDTGSRAIRHIFKDIKIVHGSYIIKNSDKDSELGLHQDMTLVDESRYAGVNIWAPLVDLTAQNGALYVLRKSHRIFPTYRGASIPNIYDKHSASIRAYLTPLYLKAGQAVIFDQSIIHYSPPNLSGKIRITTNIFITQKDATFRMYYFDQSRKQDQIEIFEQQDNFMSEFMQFGYDIYSRPGLGKSIGFTDYNFPVLDLQTMERHYSKLPPQQSYLSKIVTRLQHAFK